MSHGNQDKIKELASLEATMEKIKILFRDPASTEGEKAAARKKYNLLLSKLNALREQVAKLPKEEADPNVDEGSEKLFEKLDERIKASSARIADWLKANKFDQYIDENDGYSRETSTSSKHSDFQDSVKYSQSQSSDKVTEEKKSRSKLPINIAKIQVIFIDDCLYEIDKMTAKFIEEVLENFKEMRLEILEDAVTYHNSKEDQLNQVQNKAYELTSLDTLIRRLEYEREKRKPSSNRFNTWRV